MILCVLCVKSVVIESNEVVDGEKALFIFKGTSLCAMHFFSVAPTKEREERHE